MSSHVRVPGPSAPRRAARCAALAALPAPLVALAWWLVAPGGRTGPTERIGVLEASGHADAVFTTCAALTAFLVALVWVGRRSAVPGPGAAVCVAGLVAGSLAGSLAAWALGVGIDAVVPSGGPQPLRLTATPALLVWPLVTAAVVAVDTARDLVGTWAQARAARQRPVS